LSIDLALKDNELHKTQNGVSLLHVLTATNRLFSSANVSKIKQLNLHSSLLLAAFVDLHPASASKVDLVQLADAYCQLCLKSKLASPLSRSELHDLIENLVSAGILVHAKAGVRANSASNSQVSTALSAEEIKQGLQHIPILRDLMA
jgi:Cdc6-like AAA superfamily ATPase